MRILIADDHESMRMAIRQLLSSLDRVEICGEAETGKEAIEKACLLQPDIVTMDVSLPDLSGFQSRKEFEKYSPPPKL